MNADPVSQNITSNVSKLGTHLGSVSHEFEKSVGWLWSAHWWRYNCFRQWKWSVYGVGSFGRRQRKWKWRGLWYWLIWVNWNSMAKMRFLWFFPISSPWRTNRVWRTIWTWTFFGQKLKNKLVRHDELIGRIRYREPLLPINFILSIFRPIYVLSSLLCCDEQTNSPETGSLRLIPLLIAAIPNLIAY